MPINPKRVKLDSELADLDQQLQTVDSRRDLSEGQKVLHRGRLQHLRQEKSLGISIMEQEAVVESCKRDVEAAQKRYDWAKTPDGLKALVKQLMPRLRGTALGGGAPRNYSSLDSLTPAQRVIETARSNLTEAEYGRHNAQTRLSDLTRELQGLQSQDTEWAVLLGKAQRLRPPSAWNERQVRRILQPSNATLKRPGRTPKLPPHFVELAGKLWLDAQRQSSRSTVAHEQLVQIASTLDTQGYVPPADYLEKRCAEELKAFNSRHSNSKGGVIKTWSQLVSIADKDHLRGMRRLLSRCAEKSSSSSV